MTHPPSPAAESRISTVVGDRICIKCSFNLSGQPVHRESVYGMAIVRCPECSTIASLQEYPLLGRWAGRIAAMLGAIWLLALIGGIFASAGIMFGMSQVTVESGSRKLAHHISQLHHEWFQTATDQEKATYLQSWAGQGPTIGPYVWIDGTWWARQDRDAIVAKLGGIRGAVGWSMSGSHAWLAIFAAALGAVWSVFLLHLPRWKLLVFALIPISLAVLFALMTNTSSRLAMGFGAAGVYALHEATAMLWPWLIGIGLGVGLVFFCIGLLIGRPLIRGLVRLLLPPRMLGSLSFLWIVCGKKPPSHSAPPLVD